MKRNIEVTCDTWFQPVAGTEDSGGRIKVALVRLLALAVALTDGKLRRAPAAGVAIPRGYRSWPHVECEADLSDRRRRRRLFVCPKAAAAGDHDAFPVGTVMVVETTEPDGGEAAEPDSVFVMTKFSSVRARAARFGCLDGWAYALHRFRGSAIGAGSKVSGLHRLPVGHVRSTWLIG
jgi:hypothetical protein